MEIEEVQKSLNGIVEFLPSQCFVWVDKCTPAPSPWPSLSFFAFLVFDSPVENWAGLDSCFQVRNEQAKRSSCSFSVVRHQKKKRKSRDSLRSWEASKNITVESVPGKRHTFSSSTPEG